MNNYDNGRNMGEHQRQPGPMRHPRGPDSRERPDGRPPYDGYNRPPPSQPMRSPMHNPMAHPMQPNGQSRIPHHHQDPNYGGEQPYSPQGQYSPQGPPQNYGAPPQRGPPPNQGQRRPGPPMGRPMLSTRGPPPPGAQGYNNLPHGNHPSSLRPGQRPPVNQPMQGQYRPQGPTPVYVSPVRTEHHAQAEAQIVSPRGNIPPQQAAPPSPASAWPLGRNQDRAPAQQQPHQQQHHHQQERRNIEQPQQPQPAYQQPQHQHQRTPEQTTPAGDSLHSRSHGSYASSAAIPDAWGTGITAPIPAQREAQQTDSQAVFSKAVVEQAPRSTAENSRNQKPVINAFVADKAPASASQPSNAPSKMVASVKETSDTQDAMLKAYAAASSSEPVTKESIKKTPMVTTRESFDGAPPKLDVNLKSHDGRGSMSSLSDLILRATKLATIIDKDHQQRPRSKMVDVSNYNHDKSDYMTDTTGKPSHENGNSEFSDMLASFPPPSTVPPSNGPRGPGPWFQRVSQHLRPVDMEKIETQQDAPAPKKGRRCCGMPAWAFIILMLLLLCAIAAAIIIPLEMFVFKGFGGMGQEPSPQDKCKTSLPCMNGGTSVLSDGVCSCICTGGFTGVNCNTAAAIGCATTNLVGQNGVVEVSNVTVGIAIPRLVADASANYSLALSGTQILAKFSKTSLSCLAQNALVTFNGNSGRPGASSPSKHVVLDSMPVMQQGITSLLDEPKHQTISSGTVVQGSMRYSGLSMANARLQSRDTKPKDAPPKDSNKGTPSKDNVQGFKSTDKILDFARVAVLYVLQQQNLDAATKAQEELQKFFQKTQTGDAKHGTLVTEKDATNITIGGLNSINLVKLSIILA